MTIKRSNVYISTNELGTVYEATDNPHTMRVYLQQDEIHEVDDIQVKKVVRRCSWDTDIQLYQPNFRLPGMIIRTILYEQIEDDWLVGMMTTENGEIVHIDGRPLYEHMWYDPGVKLQKEGISEYDDQVECTT